MDSIQSSKFFIPIKGLGEEHTDNTATHTLIINTHTNVV